MSAAKDLKDLKHLQEQLAQARAERSSLPLETCDPKEIAVLALALDKENMLEAKVTALKDSINSRTAWQAKLTPASKIQPMPIRWLWPQWIALGKLTILAGAGGAGKTTMALSLAATLTGGGPWPDGTINNSKRNVIIWSSEDDHADTLIPRLIAVDADLNRVHFIDGRINAEGETEPFDPATDLDILRTAAQMIGGVSLLILDPVVNLIKGDMHRANDVRRGLQAVVDFAEEMECAVLGISHFSKGGAGTPAADRVIGSQAFGALARTVLVAGKQDDSETRVLARAKSNISDDQGGCSYSIEVCTVETSGGNILETTKTVWGEFIEGSASEILATIEASSNAVGEDDPVEALRSALRDGRMSSQEVNRIMAANGYTTKQTRTAREKLKVLITREGFGKDLKSYWELPKPSLNDRVGLMLAENADICQPFVIGAVAEPGLMQPDGAHTITDDEVII